MLRSIISGVNIALSNVTAYTERSYIGYPRRSTSTRRLDMIRRQVPLPPTPRTLTVKEGAQRLPLLGREIADRGFAPAADAIANGFIGLAVVGAPFHR